MEKSLKRKMVDFILKASYKEAEKNANRTCLYWHHQPKLPEEVKKLRKF